MIPIYWPMDTDVPLAWIPPEDAERQMSQAAAIPLELSDLDRPMTLERYLDRLADRVAWMVVNDPPADREKGLIKAISNLHLAAGQDGDRAMIQASNLASDVEAAGPTTLIETAREMAKALARWASLGSDLRGGDHSPKPESSLEAIQLIRQTGWREWMVLAFNVES
ncbi:MAG: hypothetical protein AMXMBFR20_09570 [Planctomycetia bacterium]